MALPRAFVRYVALTAAVAVAALAVVVGRADWQIDSPALFWLLVVLAIVGELLPIPVPRRHGLAKVTISTAFAFAILLRFGVAPATVVYVASVVIAQTVERVDPVKALFNVSQYALAMMAAAGVVTLMGTLPLSQITTSELPAVLVGGTAFFVANHALACTAAAFLFELPVSRYIREDLAFQTWTAGCLLSFAPAVLASAQASTALVPVCFLPMLAIYFGGRQAAINSHRASHDSLTELPNRAALSERLQKALEVAEREQRGGGGDAARRR